MQYGWIWVEIIMVSELNRSENITQFHSHVDHVKRSKTVFTEPGEYVEGEKSQRLINML